MCFRSCSFRIRDYTLLRLAMLYLEESVSELNPSFVGSEANAININLFRTIWLGVKKTSSPECKVGFLKKFSSLKRSHQGQWKFRDGRFLWFLKLVDDKINKTNFDTWKAGAPNWVNYPLIIHCKRQQTPRSINHASLHIISSALSPHLPVSH